MSQIVHETDPLGGPRHPNQCPLCWNWLGYEDGYEPCSRCGFHPPGGLTTLEHFGIEPFAVTVEQWNALLAGDAYRDWCLTLEAAIDRHFDTIKALADELGWVETLRAMAHIQRELEDHAD